LVLWLLLWLQAQGHNLTRVLATNPQQFPPTVQRGAVRLRVNACRPTLPAGLSTGLLDCLAWWLPKTRMRVQFKLQASSKCTLADAAI
jgi:hypothetical protein